MSLIITDTPDPARSSLCYYSNSHNHAVIIPDEETERQKNWGTGPRPQRHVAVGPEFRATRSGSTAHAKTTSKAQNLRRAWDDFLFFSPNPTHAHNFADVPWFSHP